MSEIKRYKHDHYGIREHVDGLFVTYADHLAAAEAAVMAEREACAQIADDLYKLGNHLIEYDAGYNWGVEHVEQTIRARTTQPAEGSK